ncbi:hypothetical protein SESBI_25662 [Sesbania bispinosa]|nr:hypothetical protein SESBI_25662 [Sesbania bispinosa]
MKEGDPVVLKRYEVVQENRWFDSGGGCWSGWKEAWWGAMEVRWGLVLMWELK